jgi:hypothetical protein
VDGDVAGGPFIRDPVTHPEHSSVTISIDVIRMARLFILRMY